ncbi:signal peptide peptidase SppA [Candidatus Acetothermia bacterium]|nr:signal peptide peptidase SppA [Candidatus Acetothermia bacterium]MBI3737904.1 signal peptide peptidase SppA [Chloroflexota bacterium]
MIAGDSRIRGVVLHLRPMPMHLAQLQTLRDLIKVLQAAGKRVVVWAYSYDNALYYVACQADVILLQNGGIIGPLGLRQSYLFLADALERVGLSFDFVQVSPYKTAGDVFTRKRMSDEAREMANWLIDARYEELIQGVMEGRKLNRPSGEALLDNSPYTDQQALNARVVDKVISEEDLPAYLGKEGKPAHLAYWEASRRSVLRPRPTRPGPYVALIRIEGLIVDGKSQRPPVKLPLPIPLLFDERAGDLSIVQQARKALKDRRAAAVVVFVDSGGGSATASESMAAALRKLADKKPLIVVFGAQAASGGYYVSTPAHWIMAQPAAVTGSIGVLIGKLINANLFNKVYANRETISRGKHITILDAERQFDDEERKIIGEHIQRIYSVFVDRVCVGRKMPREAVEKVAGGRVWTARQALTHGLIDELGGLEKALVKARQLAGLPSDAPVREVKVRRQLLAPIAQTTGLIGYAMEGLYLLRKAHALCLSPIIWDNPFDDV